MKSRLNGDWLRRRMTGFHLTPTAKAMASSPAAWPAEDIVSLPLSGEAAGQRHGHGAMGLYWSRLVGYASLELRGAASARREGSQSGKVKP
jgi:hypothetical protein